MKIGEIKIGDKVRVINETIHYFSAGSMVEIVKIFESGAMCAMGIINRESAPHVGHQTIYPWQVAPDQVEYLVKWS